MNPARPRLLRLGVDATAPVDPPRDNPTPRRRKAPRGGAADPWIANPGAAPLGGGWVA